MGEGEGKKERKEWDVWRLAVLKSRSDSQNGPPLFKWKCALTRTTSDNRVVSFFRWMHLRLSAVLLCDRGDSFSVVLLYIELHL